MLEKGSRLFLKKRIAAAFFLLIGGFMKYLINKNFLKNLAKSMNNEADSFRKIKAEILEHLRNIEKKENSELKKAVAHICENEHLFGYLEKSDFGEWVEKSGFGVGTVRTWRGKKYKKISIKPNRWVRVYDKADRGAKNAITRLIHRAEKIESPEEMMQFVLANKQRFMDTNGKPLDIVDRLKKVIDAKNAEYDSKLSAKKNENSISQDATKYGFKTDDFSKRGYKVVGEYKGHAILKKNGKYAVAGKSLSQDKLSIVPYKADSIDRVKEAFDKEEAMMNRLKQKKQESENAQKKRTDENNKLKGVPVGLKDKARELLQRIKGYTTITSYNASKTKSYTLKKTDSGYSFIVDDFNSDTSKTYEIIKTGEEELNRSNKKSEEKASEGYDKLYARLTYYYLSDTLEKGHKHTIDNPELGEISVEAGETGKSGWGLKHIIEQRYKKDGKSIDEIVVMIPLILNAAKEGKINRENARVYELEKDGIIAIIRKADDKSNKWILTGFEDWNKQKETTDSIKTVIAQYGYSPEFSSFRRQVGAVIASVDNVTQKKSTVKNKDKTKTLSDIRNHYESSNSVTGNKKTIYAGDEKIKGHWKLVEADAPMASHDEKTFAKTDGFPQSKNGGTINDRDYEHDKDAQESVRDIAANFNGRALDMGEPVIVTKDGIVISGNNRTMSSKLAAKNGTDKQYLSDLREQIEDFGFDEEDLDGFKHPRIVFEIDNEHEGDYTTEEFAMFNKTGKKAKNSTEKAVEISKTIKSEAVKNVADVISSYDTMGEMWADRDASRKIMNSFVESGVIGKNDMAQYYTEEGGMSAAGKEFVETCLIGSIMNETNIRTLSGDGGKAIRQKLVRAIVPLIENKGDGNEYSFNSELNEAVRIASFVAKNHGTYPTIKTYFDQQDMFESEANPIVKKLAELIHDNTQKEFAQQMKNLEAGIRPNAAGEMDIFLGECETRNSVITRILRIKDTVKKSISTTFDYVQKSIENLRKCRAI